MKKLAYISLFAVLTMGFTFSENSRDTQQDGWKYISQLEMSKVNHFSVVGVLALAALTTR